MTYIIAEVGSNWRTFDDCKHSIQMAKQCGADAVKFQLFMYHELYGVPKDGQMVGPNALPTDWLPKLADKAKAAGIDFLCTAFSVEGLKLVDPYVKAHKIASSDLCHVELLRAAKATGKPIYLSTGASSKGDVDRAVRLLEEPDGLSRDRLTLMYCASSYPSRMHNLFEMEWMRKTWGRPVGLSDHSLDVVYAPLSAVRHFGATVIEKHFTAIDAETPDSPHSLNVEQFKYMVDHIRGARKDIGFGPTPEERGMLLRHNRRLIATRDIAEGEMLDPGKNFGCYRSLKDDRRGLSGFDMAFVAGKTAAKAIKAGDSIGPGDFA